MRPRSTLSFLFLAFAFTFARAEDLSVVLVAPDSCQSAGMEIAVKVLWLNYGTSTQRVCPPAVIDATLRQSHTTWPVRLRDSDAPPLTSLPVEQDCLVQRTYYFAPPPEVRGMLDLSIEQPFVATATIDIAPGAAAIPAPEAPANSTATGLRPVASRLHRTVIDNFGFHEPMYFLYGPDAPAAKFQFSFRYRLAGRRDSPVESDPALKGLYFAYTQRSLWDIKEPSSPFYDTSYMPELMFESLASEQANRQGRVSFIGYQTGYRHESNGRDGLDSRSLDIVYARFGLMFGRPDGWRALVVPRVFAYLSKDADNPDIADYRGYGELLLSFGRNDGVQVNVTTPVGQDPSKRTVQVDLTYPIKIPAVHFDTFLHVQYFDGYGESLRDYDRKSSTWRAGVSLVR